MIVAAVTVDVLARYNFEPAVAVPPELVGSPTLNVPAPKLA